MFSYRTILKQALGLSWKNKYLWILGLFASLTIAGGSIEYQFITQSFNQGILNTSYQGLADLLGIAAVFEALYIGIVDLFSQNIIVILNSLSIILLTLTLLFVAIWLAISSQAGLVDMAKKLINPKKKVIDLSLRSAITIGHQHFWPVLGLNILIRLLISAALFVVSLPLLFMMVSNSYVLIGVYTALFVIFVPLAVSLSLMVKYAISYKVLEGESTINSLEKGYSLFKKNWLISLETALILFFVTLFSSFLLLIAMTIILLPIFITGLILSINWLTYLALFIAIFVIIMFGSFMTTFQITSWTSLYLHLRENKALAKLERLFRKK